MTVSVTPPVVSGAGLSLQRNFAWMLGGNVFYALCQWGMIIVLAKLTNPFMVGQFSLGLAIATPVIMLMNLQLRIVQATDVPHAYSFGEYLGLRSVTTLIAIGGIVLITCLISHESKTVLVVVAVAAAKAIETISDIFYGLFQLNDRLDQTGRSMMFRGGLSLFALSAGLYITRDVLWGVIGLAGAWLTALIVFDVRRGRRFLPSAAALRPRYHPQRQWTLARLAFPLGIVMTLASLNMNVPRYFVQSAMGETELGVFSTMAYTMTAMSTVTDAMSRSAVPKLARLYIAGKLGEFRSLLLKLGGLALAMGVLATAGIAVLGAQVLAVLYGASYASYSSIFVWLTAANGVSAIAMLLTSGLDSAKQFRVQVPMFAAVVATNVIFCAILVPHRGLTGAAIAPLIASVVHLILASVIVTRLLANRPAAATTDGSEPYSESWGNGL